MKCASLIIGGILIFLITGCVGRTGKVGTPISAVYASQLQSLQLGVTTPDDLKNIFTITVTNEVTQSIHASPGTTPQPAQPKSVNPVDPQKSFSLISGRYSWINGKKFAIYDLTKGGGMDVAAFVVWGYVAYNKDQEILFHFENSKLVSYESVVLPDPVEPPVTPISKTPK